MVASLEEARQKLEQTVDLAGEVADFLGDIPDPHHNIVRGFEMTREGQETLNNALDWIKEEV